MGADERVETQFHTDGFERLVFLLLYCLDLDYATNSETIVEMMRNVLRRRETTNVPGSNLDFPSTKRKRYFSDGLLITVLLITHKIKLT